MLTFDPSDVNAARGGHEARRTRRGATPNVTARHWLAPCVPCIAASCAASLRWWRTLQRRLESGQGLAIGASAQPSSGTLTLSGSSSLTALPRSTHAHHGYAGGLRDRAPLAGEPRRGCSSPGGQPGAHSRLCSRSRRAVLRAPASARVRRCRRARAPERRAASATAARAAARLRHAHFLTLRALHNTGSACRGSACCVPRTAARCGRDQEERRAARKALRQGCC
jgi:hypothetical protein